MTVVPEAVAGPAPSNAVPAATPVATSYLPEGYISDPVYGVIPAPKSATGTGDTGENSLEIPDDFWEPPKENSGTGQTQPAPLPQQPTTPPDPNAVLRGEFDRVVGAANTDYRKALTGLGLPDTPEAADALKGVLQESNYAVFRGALQLMNQLVDQRLRQVDESVNQRLNQRENTTQLRNTLQTEFPVLATKEGNLLRPVVENTFAQAMRRANGDRTQALAMTKAALGRMGVNLSSKQATGRRSSRFADADTIDSLSESREPENFLDTLLGR